MSNDQIAEILEKASAHGSCSIVDVMRMAHESGMRVVLNEINKNLDDVDVRLQAS
jgi:hypothetical protein